MKKYIDLDDAISRVDDWANYNIKVFLEHLPVVELEPVVAEPKTAHGRWVLAAGKHDGQIAWGNICSQCGKKVFPGDEPEYNYCPYCGAKMDGWAEAIKSAGNRGGDR